jgi:hypothetical protein
MNASNPTLPSAVSAVPDVPPSFDFPTWMPAMLVKELRQGLRQRGFVGGLLAVQGALLVAFISGFVSAPGDGFSRNMIDGFFWFAMGAVLLAAGPLRAVTSLNTEIESRTMDLLLLTRLDAWRIVWGKWVSLVAQSVLLAVTLLPYAMVRYFFGSVDLVQDFALITMMFVIGAVFTGVGLWASGLPRVLRGLVIAGCGLFAVGGMNGLIFGMRHSGFSLLGGGSHTWLVWPVGLWSAVVYLLYSLSLAVRWFAPPAENHSVLPRLVPLALALPAPVLALAGEAVGAGAQMVAAVVMLAVVAAIELAGTRELMAIHLRGRLAGGGWRGVLAPFFLPGWPSVAVWLAAMLVFGVAAWGAADLLLDTDLHFLQVAWLALLGWTGLVFPVLLLSLIPSATRAAGVMYFVIHAVLGIFASMAGSTSLSRMAPTPMVVLDWISHAVPTTSFWHALAALKNPSNLPAVWLGQLLGVLVTLGLMLVLSRAYWARVLAMRDTARVAAEAR